MSGLLVSVNVGRIEAVDHHDRTVTTGIFKRPVAGRVATDGVNLVGDDQADRSVHGGPDRALYAYAAEDLEWWADELGRPIAAGTMGENLTTADVDVTNAVIGERWRIGTVLLEVTAPRVPCFKLGIKMGDGRFPIRFAAAGRPGAYLRIIEHGELGAGDVVTVDRRPGPRRHRRPRRPRLPRRPLARRHAARPPRPSAPAGRSGPAASSPPERPARVARDAVAVTTYYVRFEGPVELALRVATALGRRRRRRSAVVGGARPRRPAGSSASTSPSMASPTT